MRVSRAESSECARNSDASFARARCAEFRAWMLLVGAALFVALVTMLSGSTRAGVALEGRKLSDEVQLGRLPTELPGLGQGGRNRDCG